MLFLVNVSLFIISFIAILVIGDHLTLYAKNFSRISGLSEGIVGTVLISVVTSLPEVSSSISAVFIANNPTLMTANIFGSNFFNLTVLWIILLIVIVTKFKLVDPSKNHNLTMIYSLVLPIILIMFFFIPVKTVLFLSIPTLIVIFFIPFFIKSILNSEEDEDIIGTSDKGIPKKKKVIFLFALFSFLIVVFGLVLGKTSDFIACYEFKNGFRLGSSFVGALFLAISTSLPEVSVTFHSIFKYRSINLAYGNILGSNFFNCLVFILIDVFSFKQAIISSLNTINLILILSLFTSGIFFLLQKKVKKTYKILFSVLMIFLYIFTITFLFGKM